MAKQPEIKEELGDEATVTSISKRSAAMWKGLSAEERAHWDDVAAKDKERYMVEKSTYTGPWQVPWKRAKKDPSAPKRPMSAFLYYAQERRTELKKLNPDKKNTEISRMLGEEWRGLPEKERRTHIEKEKAEREKYKVAVAQWREEYEAKLEAERKAQAEHNAMLMAGGPGAAAAAAGGAMAHSHAAAAAMMGGGFAPGGAPPPEYGGAHPHYMYGQFPGYRKWVLDLFALPSVRSFFCSEISFVCEFIRFPYTIFGHWFYSPRYTHSYRIGRSCYPLFFASEFPAPPGPYQFPMNGKQPVVLAPSGAPYNPAAPYSSSGGHGPPVPSRGGGRKPAQSPIVPGQQQQPPAPGSQYASYDDGANHAGYE